MEVAIKVETKEDLKQFNEVYNQEEIAVPALYICVNGVYVKNDVKEQAFFESIGYKIITVR